ncbi:MAG: hypothetical protein JWM47_3435 [Acidimicrobiales bacterium]|nr:hypothetical protein [Acidimicrobiales bacterium]
MLRHRALVAVLASVLLAVPAACSSSDSDAPSPSTTAPASVTTTAGERADAAYADEGPNQVGVTSFALDDGRRVVSWYPAADSAADQPTETFDIAGLLSPALQSQIPADKRPQYEIDAHPGAEQATGGPYPVVLFSHGFAGFPEQSADLVTHLASWGFVVVAPDHVERSLSGLLGVAAKGVPELTDTEVLSRSLDAAVADAERDASPLHGLLDLDHVAVAGHSAGAGAAYEAASAEPRIKAFISYSVGLGRGEAGEDVPPPPVPEVPGMVMAATDDATIPVAESRAVYDAMRAPKYLVEIAGAGHLVFSDICLVGRDQGGLVALIEEVGLVLPANFLQLASDGCEAGALDPVKAFPAIDHLSVAFLRTTFGIDDAPVGLDPATAASFTEAEITLTADPG